LGGREGQGRVREEVIVKGIMEERTDYWIEGKSPSPFISYLFSGIALKPSKADLGHFYSSHWTGCPNLF
jgi:hypothetical protein